MPFDAITLRDVALKKEDTGAGHDQTVRVQYEAPADGDATVARDDAKEFDLWCAHNAFTLLEDAYPGYGWRVKHDTYTDPKTATVHKLMLISIPILMGVNNFMAINHTHSELTPGRVLTAGGELLERYGQRRGPMQLAQFLEARAQHSALVVRSRKVPE